MFELRSCVRTVVIEYKTEPLVNGKSKFFFFLFLDYGFVLTCFKHSSLVNYLNRKRIKYNFVCGNNSLAGVGGGVTSSEPIGGCGVDVVIARRTRSSVAYWRRVCQPRNRWLSLAVLKPHPQRAHSITWLGL